MNGAGASGESDKDSGDVGSDGDGAEGVGGGGDGDACPAGGEAATLPVSSSGSMMLPTLLLPVNVSVSVAT